MILDMIIQYWSRFQAYLASGVLFVFLKPSRKGEFVLRLKGHVVMDLRR